jgi:hypothetical protein
MTESKRSEPGEAFSGYRLQDRDQQLLAMLAMCRYLSTEQIRRLSFPGRTETPADKRLRQLAGIGRYGFTKPFVERTAYRNYAGDLIPVWKPTPLGYVAAANIVEATPRPPCNAEIRPEFMEHLLLLNELFVGLAEAPLKKALATRIAEIPRRRHRSAADGLYANATALEFAWIPSDSVRLPWKEYRDGNSWKRIILPDAVLELPKLRRRLFLECETGSHTIVPRRFYKPGSTLGKALRYESFICELADFDSNVTFYQRQYPDRFAPEVLFLVPRPERADSINRALTAWAIQRRRQWKLPRALTITDAIREVLTILGQWSSELGPRHATVPSGASVGLPEIKLLCCFFEDAMTTLTKLRAEARATNSTPPPYPDTMEETRKLVSVRRAPSGRRSACALHDRAWRDETSGRSGLSNGPRAG